MALATRLKIARNQIPGAREPALADSEHLQATLGWLERAHDVSLSGGVAGLYSLKDGWYDGYPETTGYIIETFVESYRETGNASHLGRAVRMANWEIDIQLVDGGVRGGLLKKGLNDYPIVFNTGQVMLGWNALYRLTGERPYLDASQRAGHWLVRQQGEDGTWNRHVYLDHCGTYHSRVAWAMLQTAVDAGDEDLFLSATRYIQWVLLQQESSGFFRNMAFTPSDRALTHTIAYTCEGLVGASTELAKSDKAVATLCQRAFLLACEQLMIQVERAKTLWGEYREDWKPATTKFQCLTGNAQIAWCFFKSYELTNDVRYLNAGLNLVDSVKQSQYLSSTQLAIRGGVPGSFPIWGKYHPWRFVNWAAKFFADALMLKVKLLRTIAQ